MVLPKFDESYSKQFLDLYAPCYGVYSDRTSQLDAPCYGTYSKHIILI